MTANARKTRFSESIYLESNKQPALFQLLTTPLAFVYSILITLRNFLFDSGLKKSHTLPGRVIAIGNITVGGTGKSPMVMEVADYLVKTGQKPAILTRGYGSDLQSTDSFVLLNGKTILSSGSAVIVPDEAMMHSMTLQDVPVIVGSRRHIAAKRFLSEVPYYKPTHWILDDGFQHRQIKRDVDVVLLDAKSPFGNGKVIPRGTLREHLSSLKRSDVILFTRSGADSPNDLNKRTAHTFCSKTFEINFKNSRPKSINKSGEEFSDSHQPALLATAIAEPSRLLINLDDQGVKIRQCVALRDHSRFDKQILMKALGESASIVTTSKDYWRDPAVFMDIPIPVFILPLKVVIEENTLKELI